MEKCNNDGARLSTGTFSWKIYVEFSEPSGRNNLLVCLVLFLAKSKSYEWASRMYVIRAIIQVSILKE